MKIFFVQKKKGELSGFVTTNPDKVEHLVRATKKEQGYSSDNEVKVFETELLEAASIEFQKAVMVGRGYIFSPQRPSIKELNAALVYCCNVYDENIPSNHFMMLYKSELKQLEKGLSLNNWNYGLILC